MAARNESNDLRRHLRRLDEWTIFLPVFPWFLSIGGCVCRMKNFLNSKWHRKSFLTIFFSGRKKNKTFDVATRNDSVFIKSSSAHRLFAFICSAVFFHFKLVKFNFIVFFFNLKHWQRSMKPTKFIAFQLILTTENKCEVDFWMEIH